MAFGFGFTPSYLQQPDEDLLPKLPVGAGAADWMSLILRPNSRRNGNLPPPVPAHLTNPAPGSGMPQTDPDSPVGAVTREDPRVDGASYAALAPSQPPAALADTSPSLGSKIMGGIGDASDLLLGLGSGLMSAPNWGQGIAQGLKQGQTAQTLRATTTIAQTKAAREQNALLGNAALYKKVNPNATDQEALAAASNSAVMTDILKRQLPPDEQYRQETDSDGNVWNTSLRTGQKVIALKADEDKTMRPLTDPAERAKYGLRPEDTAPYQIDANGKVSQVGGSGTNVTVNSAVNPVVKGLADQFVESAATARNSADSVRAIQSARSQIDAPGGIISGKWADNRLALQKMGSFLGVTDPNAIQNTETFRTQIKPIVLETVKGLGAGAGISNADREFALAAVGGDINLDEGSIKRVLDITERAARAKIDRHNVLSDKMIETQPQLKEIAPMLRIEPPAPSSQAAQPSATMSAPAGMPAPQAVVRRRFNPKTGAFE